MPRKSMVQLQADLATSFPDNTTGLITPAVIREYFNSLIEAIRPAYASVSRTTPNVQTVGIAFDPFVGQSAAVSDIPDFAATAATTLIDRLEAGTTRFSFNTSFECAAGRRVSAQLFKNGSGTLWASASTGNGTGDPANLEFSGLAYDSGSADYQIRVSCDTAGTAVTFYDAVFLCESVPVNTY
jgi:hypothetical protein